jgi:hypothetical protein
MSARTEFGPVPAASSLCFLAGSFFYEAATPLASIRLISERLAESSLGSLTPKQLHSLRLIVEATDEIQLLLQRGVLLSRLATHQVDLHASPFSLESLIGELGAAHPGLAITRVPPLVASFTSDRRRLFELVQLMVEVGLGLDPAPDLRVASSPLSGLSFMVEAKGTLSDEQLARACDPFRAGPKVARQAGTSGFELALVYHLNRVLGGRLEISQPAGKVHLEASFPL